MSDTITIGVDHGYAAMKTKNFSFPSGLVAYEHEPYTQRDVLEYDGRYYVVGSGRQPLQKEKTDTEDYYLLTLAAIAKEIAHRQADRSANIHLAAGLPLTSFGRDKKKFRDYLYRGGAPVSFRYEGMDYRIAITEVSLFPQGYAAVLTQSDLLDEPSVIVADIGGWTVDLMRLDGRIPNAATCRSLELGMIRCLDEMAEQVRRTLGLSLTAAQIESVLRGDASSVDGRAKGTVRREAASYVRRLLSAILESGLDTRSMPTIFLGGGACLIKRFLWDTKLQPSEAGAIWRGGPRERAQFSPSGGNGDEWTLGRRVPPTEALCRPFILDDVSLNAKGYERLVGHLLGAQAKPSVAGSLGRGGATE